jgi:hypothetical protein
MISFLDLFKWDRFVATSFIELLFWLLTAIAVLLGIAGVAGGVVQAGVDPAGGLVAIALSILGGFAGIVAARALCEAVIMLFRVNENLMDIRDSLAAAQGSHAPEHAAPPPQFVAVEPVEPVPSFADVLELALSEPDPVAVMPVAPPELAWQDPLPTPKAAETKSPETSSLEARLAEIRARRESATASAVRSPAPATAPPEKPSPAVGRGAGSEPVAPVVAPEPVPAAVVVAPEVKPVARPAEPKRAEVRKPDEVRKSDEAKKPDESKKPDEARKPGEPKKPDEARKSEGGKKPDEARQPDENKTAGKDVGAVAVPAEVSTGDTLEDEISKALAREASASAQKPKAG